MFTVPKRIRLVMTVCFVLIRAYAFGQTVILVNGSGVQPPDLVRNTPVGPGTRITRIEVPRNAIVVVEEKWRSNRPNYDCVSWTVITGTAYVVTTQKREGTCAVSGSGDELARAQRGEPYTGRAVFYGDAKYDDPNPIPSDVAASRGLGTSLKREFSQLASTHVVQVSAQADWFATGIQLRRGERLEISAEGQWSNGGGTPRTVGPEGFVNYPFPGTPLASADLASLIARVGAGSMFPVGKRFTGLSPAAGELFLMMNDTRDSLSDNTGALRVRIFTPDVR